MTPSPTAEILRVRAPTLREFIFNLARRLRVPEAGAGLVSDSLVAASLRGVDSHGVELFPVYEQQIREGVADPTAVGAVANEAGACLLFDGKNGLGQVVSAQCTDHAVRLARAHGLAVVVARNSHHFGAAAYWSQRMAQGGCIGISLSTAGAIVPPWQGKTPRLGTNPIAVALPGSAGGKWLLDMATTTVAKGKLNFAAAHGRTTIPEAWRFVDADGHPTTDRVAAERGWSLPVGGYKGSGLAVLVELLTSGLSGGPMASEAPVHRNGVVPLRISHTFIAIDPQRFLPLGTFEERMERLVAMLKSSEPAPGYDEVLMAGEPEWREEAVRLRDGIPLPGHLWRRLLAIAANLEVASPAPDGV
jgi:LDH2 family malate/lactate/ureidoglycolate dehydrogenase